jgi:hypothetical protein
MLRENVFLLIRRKFETQKCNIKLTEHCAGFEILTEVVTKSSVFWDIYDRVVH